MANKSSLILEPVETTRASVAIFEQIKSKILSGELKPGDHLPSERQMMEMLQRSRPTIREALRMLEQSGFIKTTIGTAGPVVQEYKIDNVSDPMETLLKINKVTIWELYEYRMQCERFVVAWAASRRTKEDLEVLKNVLERSQECINDKKFNDFSDLDIEFHQAISKASHNNASGIINTICHDITEESIVHIIDNGSEKEKVSVCKKILEAHKKIYEAIEEKDESKAKECLSAHLEAFSKDYKKTK